MIVDAHTHVFEHGPDERTAAINGVRFSAPMLVHLMDEAQVAQALLISSPNARNPANNRYVQAAAQERPDRFKAFVRIMRSGELTDLPSPTDQLLSLEDCGPVDGITLVLAGCESWLSTTEANDLFRQARASGRPVNLAMGAAGFQALREQSGFGDIPILVNEMGNARAILKSGLPAYLTELAKLVPLKNVLLKVAGLTRLSRRPWDFPLPDVQGVVRVSFDYLGARRLCWGSDFPTADLTYRQSLELIGTLFGRASESERKALLGGNLLNILRPAPGRPLS